MGDSKEFVIELHQGDLLVQKYNTTNLYFNIAKLEPCTEYTIKIIPESTEEAVNATSKTSFKSNFFLFTLIQYQE